MAGGAGPKKIGAAQKMDNIFSALRRESTAIHNIPMTIFWGFAASLAAGATVYFMITKPDIHLDSSLNHNARYFHVDPTKPAKLVNFDTSQYQKPPEWLIDLRKEIGSKPER